MSADPAAMQQLELVCFTLIVDDIVFPDGRTRMGVLGGGGPQSLFGYQLARNGQAAVALAAGVGADLPVHCTAWLRDTIGADVTGLTATDGRPTPRAWQVFEADGRRTQVWRVPEGDGLYAQLRPKLDGLPAQHSAAVHYHIGVHPLHPPLKLLHRLREIAHSNNGLLSVETYTSAERPATAQEVRALVSACDIFSPNESEAETMVGSGNRQELADRLLDAGAPLITLRCGADGSLLKNGANGESWMVPAAEDTVVVDVTGCGNAFCGGFLAAWQQTRDLRNAGAWGCTAASFMAEAEGVPAQLPRALFPSALQRHEALLKRAVRISAMAGRRLHTAGCRASPALRRLV